MKARRFLTGLTVAAMTAVTFTVTVPASPAEAASSGCRSRNLAAGVQDTYYKDPSLATYYASVVDTAAGKWNSVAVPGELRYAGSSADIKVVKGSYAYSAYAVSYWTCGSGYYNSGSRRMEINSRTMGNLLSWQDRFVVIHEFGHLMGLAHTNYGCGVSIMRGDAVTGDSGCASGNPPWSDDINSMNAIY